MVKLERRNVSGAAAEHAMTIQLQYWFELPFPGFAWL